MGWLWASSSPPKPSTPAQEPKAQPSSAPTPKAAPNEPVDPEIQKFFALLGAESAAEASRQQQKDADAKQTSSTGDNSSSSSSSWFSLRASSSNNTSNTTAYDDDNAPSKASLLDPLSESLLPTEMSCRQAFDLAWACNSLGGQWNAVYRHGSMQSCTPQWDDFWFCMRTKSHAADARARVIAQHYREKEAAKYRPGMPSSEDVWQAREHKLPPGSAFSQGMDVPELDDEEWRKMEAERRRQIRQDLGFNKAAS